MMDLRKIKGQNLAKRAVIIAAAGNHHILLLGPTGCGKTMLLSCLADLVDERPVVTTHRSANLAMLLGCAKTNRCGTFAEANGGTLLLDDITQFNHRAVAALPRILDDGVTTASAEGETVVWPAVFQLMASSSSPKLDPALVDRFDLIVVMYPVPASDMALPSDGDETVAVKAQIAAARERRAGRDGVEPGVASDDARMALLKAGDHGMSARRWNSTIEIARTIADLEGSDDIRSPHMKEAIILGSLPRGVPIDIPWTSLPSW